MSKPRLTEGDLSDAAKTLGVDIALAKAVAVVESAGSGFLPSGEPKILFERHWFSRLTNGRFDKSHPHISNRSPGGYGAAGQHQHKRLAEAVALDRDAALMSASWGMFQIMGGNYRAAGFEDIQSFINAMYVSERKHLDAFVQFCISNKLHLKLQALDFTGFARGYNGPAQKGYDTKIRNMYVYFRSQLFKGYEG